MMKYVENERSNFDVNFELLISEGIVTRKELILICQINGFNEQTLNDVLYARVGYHDIERWCDDIGIIY